MLPVFSDRGSGHGTGSSTETDRRSQVRPDHQRLSLINSFVGECVRLSTSIVQLCPVRNRSNVTAKIIVNTRVGTKQTYLSDKHKCHAAECFTGDTGVTMMLTITALFMCASNCFTMQLLCTTLSLQAS